jgi:hypothetical protein
MANRILALAMVVLVVVVSLAVAKHLREAPENAQENVFKPPDNQVPPHIFPLPTPVKENRSENSFPFEVTEMPFVKPENIATPHIFPLSTPVREEGRVVSSSDVVEHRWAAVHTFLYIPDGFTGYAAQVEIPATIDIKYPMYANVYSVGLVLQPVMGIGETWFEIGVKWVRYYSNPRLFTFWYYDGIPNFGPYLEIPDGLERTVDLTVRVVSLFDTVIAHMFASTSEGEILEAWKKLWDGDDLLSWYGVAQQEQIWWSLEGDNFYRWANTPKALWDEHYIKDNNGFWHKITLSNHADIVDYPLQEDAPMRVYSGASSEYWWMETWCQFQHDQAMATLYSVIENVNLYLEPDATRLEVRFYDYNNNFEGWHLFWSGGTPTWVINSREINHPSGTVKKAKLWTDGGGGVVFSELVITQDHLWDRLMVIILVWPVASDEEKSAMFAELVDIVGQWPEAPR